MELGWFDPIAIDVGNVQYMVFSVARPPRVEGGDFELLSPSSAVWALDGLLGSPALRSRLRAQLRGVSSSSDSSSLHDALRRGIERGLVCVRRRHVRAVVGAPPQEKAPEPVLGPESVEQPTETHWVILELVDEAGNPVPNVAYSVTAGDGQVFTGQLDSNGKARVDGLASSKPCQVTFPDLDAREWKAA